MRNPDLARQQNALKDTELPEQTCVPFRVTTSDCIAHSREDLHGHLGGCQQCSGGGWVGALFWN